ncbi:MAG: 4Fe-4S dicluster domain-containing protein [Paracoccaceae bacterium]|jgi:ferredoxin|nr:4Fe-4S dicluster domain-containing protein [Paracoccaceae bacterium]
MAKTNNYRPFTPNPEQTAIMPDISGNSINGLDEKNFRRPNYVYWGNNPNDIIYGELQKWFFTVDPKDPGFAKERKKRQKILNQPLEAINEVKVKWTDTEWDKNLKSFQNKKVFDKLGATKFNSDWAFNGVNIDYENIILLGFQHEYKNIREAPKPTAGVEVMRQYSRAAFGAKNIANWLRKLGWDSEPLTGPMSGKITMIPAAIEAGFGELGKHGSIINPEFGSSFRLSAILTNAPVPISNKQDHKVDDFCSKCRICEDACPPDAIFKEKKTVRGVNKWYVDFDKCIPFFNEHQGCAICIAVCPWSKPGVGFNLATKLQNRAKRIEKTINKD